MAVYRFDGPKDGSVIRSGPYRFKLPQTAGGFQMVQIASVGDSITVTDAKAMAFVESVKDMAGNAHFTKLP